MPEPSIVVVWVLAAELGTPGTAALRTAAQEALGDAVELRVMAEPRPVARASFFENSELAIVSLVWDRATHREASLGYWPPEVGSWTWHRVQFASTDPETERGRALGFLIASMVHGERPVVPEATPAEPLVPAPPSRAAPPKARRAAPPTQAPPPEVTRKAREAPAVRAPANMALNAGAEAVGPGVSTGYGVWLDGERAILGERLWLGVALRARFGSAPEAQATTRMLAFGTEVSWRAIRPFSASWLGLRAGVFASHLTLTHLSDDDVVPDAQSRWLPGAEAALHFGYEVSPSASVFADAGAELLAGRTEISVRHAVVAVWPYASGLLRLGLRAQF